MSSRTASLSSRHCTDVSLTFFQDFQAKMNSQTSVLILVLGLAAISTSYADSNTCQPSAKNCTLMCRGGDQCSLACNVQVACAELCHADASCPKVDCTSGVSKGLFTWERVRPIKEGHPTLLYEFALHER